MTINCVSMTGDRSEAAVQRIEAALGRIARAAETPAAAAPAAGSSANVLALIEQHETLRETVAQALADLDRVIADLDQ